MMIIINIIKEKINKISKIKINKIIIIITIKIQNNNTKLLRIFLL
jgi:hypothetical protein